VIEAIRQAVTRGDAQGNSEWAARGVVTPTTTDLDPGTQYCLVWGTQGGAPGLGEDAAPVLKPFFPGPGRYPIPRRPVPGP